MGVAAHGGGGWARRAPAARPLVARSPLYEQAAGSGSRRLAAPSTTLVALLLTTTNERSKEELANSSFFLPFLLPASTGRQAGRTSKNNSVRRTNNKEACNRNSNYCIIPAGGLLIPTCPVRPTPTPPPTVRRKEGRARRHPHLLATIYQPAATAATDSGGRSTTPTTDRPRRTANESQQPMAGCSPAGVPGAGMTIYRLRLCYRRGFDTAASCCSQEEGGEEAANEEELLRHACSHRPCCY